MRITRGALPALAALALVVGACGGDPEGTVPPERQPRTQRERGARGDRGPVRPGGVPRRRDRVRRRRLRRDHGADRGHGRADRPVHAVHARRRVSRPARPPGAGDPRRDVHRAPRDGPRRHVARGHGAATGVDRWIPGENVALAARGQGERRRAVAAHRADLGRQRRRAHGRPYGATVDGMDAPGPAELDEIATLPELTVTPRTRHRDRVPRLRRRDPRSPAPGCVARSPARSTAPRSPGPRSRRARWSRPT